MKRFLKGLKVKFSSSCTEDVELEERETKAIQAKKTCLSMDDVDHQSSVVFAKDLINRSE
jgi:hypothetical protein